MRGDAVDVVARLEESEVPLRSHGSLTLNRALMAAGLVDRLQATIFPAISGATGAVSASGAQPSPIDLELIEAGRSTGASKRSSTGPPCTAESVHAPPPVKQPDREVPAERPADRSLGRRWSRGLLITS